MFDEDDDDLLDDDTNAGAMARSRRREREEAEAAERERMGAPSTPEAEPDYAPPAEPYTGDVEAGEADLRAEEAREPARREASRIMEEYDAEHVPPPVEEPETNRDAMERSAEREAEEFDFSLDDPDVAASQAPPLDDAPGGMDEPYAEAGPSGPVTLDPTAMIMPLGNPAVRATIDPYVLPAAARDRVAPPEAVDETAMMSPGELEDAGGDPFMDPMDNWTRRGNDPEPTDGLDARVDDSGLVSEEDAFAGTAPAVSDTGLGDESAGEGAYGLGDPTATMAERSAEMGAAKSTPEDRPLEEPDFTGADWSDAIRGGVGGLLQAISGRGITTPLRSERDEMQARLDARDEAKGEATSAFDEAEAERGRWDADRASRESIAEQNRERLRESDDIRALLGMRREDTAARRASTYEADAGSRVASRDAAMARTAERSTPGSAASTRARERLDALVANLPERDGTRDRVREAVAGREWTAEEVERLERSGPQWWRPYLSRMGGAPGSGGGGARRTALETEARRLGLADTAIAALDNDALEGEIREMTGRIPGSASADDILIPGVPMSEVHTRMTPAALEARRNVLYGYADGLSALEDIGRIHDEYGAQAVIDPAVIRRLEAPMARLRAMVASINNLGIIQPGERPLVDATLPDASSLIGTSLGGFAGSFEGWRGAVESAAMTRLRGLGASPEAVDAGMDFIRTAGESSYEAPRGDASGTDAGTSTVLMLDENGDEVDVPMEHVELAESRGWERAE